MRTLYTVMAIAGLSLAPLFAQPRLTLDWEAMAERLVAQLGPEPGEKILLVARPGNFDDLIPYLRYALVKAGAVDLGVIDVIGEPYPERWDPQILQRGADEARERSIERCSATSMEPSCYLAHGLNIPSMPPFRISCAKAAAARFIFTGPRTVAHSLSRDSRSLNST